MLIRHSKLHQKRSGPSAYSVYNGEWDVHYIVVLLDLALFNRPEMGHILQGRKGKRVLRLEDGFLRSVGLGADLVRPISWVIDGRGIYYDATMASDLEYLLQTAEFDTELCLRAARLRDRIVASRLTKYNINVGEAKGWQRPFPFSAPLMQEERGGQEGFPHVKRGRTVVLVPGQVETDASIAYGAPVLRRNMELLQAVREANPEAYLVYKPHPDVQIGLRAKRPEDDNAMDWCDELVMGIGMGELLPQVDEVHVLTSLTGFEALLRDKRVTCYGQPFYAGWGLTTDMVPLARRTRCLSLNELVAGALILYPTYVSRTTGYFTTPERALDELLAWRERTGEASLPMWRLVLRFLLQLRAK
ncbi:MAG: hypothetical protein A2511_17445 [Deltaproteobacteria bacterium RIFOXYD12_FULL_50_9]|nr:MAG: hypothetical protein A2511_17445 [Deltaproteobacteria bacterium RIFOXYD12_FULL_50_9]